MITSLIKSKQPVCGAWNQEWLDRKHVIALGQAIDTSTWSCYSSALNSYLNFVKNHNFPVEPTPNMLSYFTVDRNEIMLHGDTKFHFFLSIQQNPVLITAGAAMIIGADYTS